jgi:hypothetical protein
MRFRSINSGTEGFEASIHEWVGVIRRLCFYLWPALWTSSSEPQEGTASKEYVLGGKLLLIASTSIKPDRPSCPTTRQKAWVLVSGVATISESGALTDTHSRHEPLAQH